MSEKVKLLILENLQKIKDKCSFIKTPRKILEDNYIDYKYDKKSPLFDKEKWFNIQKDNNYKN